MTTGNHFKEYLKSQKTTVEELSQKTGISVLYFEEIISNQVYLKKKVIAKILKALKKTSSSKIIMKENLSSSVWSKESVSSNFYDKPLVVALKNNDTNRICYECMCRNEYGFYTVRGAGKTKFYFDENNETYSIVAWRLNR